MDISQFDLNNEKIKDLIAVCNNSIRWNLACNMIKCILKFCHCIDAIYVVNQ